MGVFSELDHTDEEHEEKIFEIAYETGKRLPGWDLNVGIAKSWLVYGAYEAGFRGENLSSDIEQCLFEGRTDHFYELARKQPTREEADKVLEAAGFMDFNPVEDFESMDDAIAYIRSLDFDDDDDRAYLFNTALRVGEKLDKWGLKFGSTRRLIIQAAHETGFVSNDIKDGIESNLSTGWKATK